MAGHVPWKGWDEATVTNEGRIYPNVPKHRGLTYSDLCMTDWKHQQFHYANARSRVNLNRVKQLEKALRDQQRYYEEQLWKEVAGADTPARLRVITGDME